MENTENKVEVEERGDTLRVDEEQTKMPEKRKRSVFGLLLSIVSFLAFLFIIFETVIAFLNFNLIREEKEPEYFVTSSIETDENDPDTKYTIYDMGLYRIVRKDTVKNYEIKLLPFFMDYK